MIGSRLNSRHDQTLLSLSSCQVFCSVAQLGVGKRQFPRRYIYVQYYLLVDDKNAEQYTLNGWFIEWRYM